MRELTLYNSFSKKEEIFVPLVPGKVTVYTCGPTVYGRPHIGNYSSFLMADLLVRYLEVIGYTVTHVKNITDVGHLAGDDTADATGEDKIEREAKKTAVDPLDIAKKYTSQYIADEALLGLREPEFRPKATETIVEMVHIIKVLLKKGNAYKTTDGIYFSVQSFPAYGLLSGNKIEDTKAGARIAIDEQKKHPADFALWKYCTGINAHHMLRWSFETGEKLSSVGEDSVAGFPGWHIECSAMSMKLLGPQIDIHTGGEDNIFPHHECEIAQSQSANEVQFVRYWLHKRRIDLGDQKMSKSLGNVLNMDDIIAMGFSPLDLRYYLLSVHYRTQLKFTEDGLQAASVARMRIQEWLQNQGVGTVASSGTQSEPLNTELIIECHEKFLNALASDLNTPAALAAIFTCINHTNKADVFTAPNVLLTFMADVKSTFNCFEEKAILHIPEAVQTLLHARAEARVTKDFAASDLLRDQIAAAGFIVKDTVNGQEVTKQ